MAAPINPSGIHLEFHIVACSVARKFQADTCICFRFSYCSPNGNVFTTILGYIHEPLSNSSRLGLAGVVKETAFLANNKRAYLILCLDHEMAQ